MRYLPLALLPILAACNSGDGFDPSFADPLIGQSRPDPCALDPLADYAGTYRGSITLDETARGGPYCIWDVEMTIRAGRYGNACALDGEAASIVEQPVAPTAGTAGAAECFAGFDAFGGGQFTNGRDPLVFPFGGREVPSRGPYFGDPSESARHVHLFAGLSPLVDAFDRSGPDLVPIELDPIDGRILDGLLLRDFDAE